MKITYDQEERTLYISFTDDDATVSRTQEFRENVYVDLDTHGRALGIEVLDVDRPEIEGVTDTDGFCTPAAPSADGSGGEQGE